MSYPFPINLKLLGILLLSTITSCSAPQPVAGPAGFVEAVFDEQTLNSMLNKPGCVQLRFYNARRTPGDTKGTCIAIAVNNAGIEINGSPIKYPMFDALSGSRAVTIDLLHADARNHCRYVNDAGEKSYCADFNKASISAFLGATDCNGVRLVPERLASGIWNMRMYPAKLNAGTATNLAAPASLLSSEPCPNLCGDPAYLHR